MGYGLSNLNDVVNQAMNKGLLNNVGEFFAEIAPLVVSSGRRGGRGQVVLRRARQGLTGLQKTDPAAAAAKFKQLAAEFQAQG